MHQIQVDKNEGFAYRLASVMLFGFASPNDDASLHSVMGNLDRTRAEV
jgi:hypothetical protein